MSFLTIHSSSSRKDDERKVQHFAQLRKHLFKEEGGDSSSEEERNPSSDSPTRIVISTEFANNCLSWLIHGLNGYEIDDLRVILRRRCIPDLRVTHFSYELATGKAARKNIRYEGQLDGIEHFLQYWTVIQAILPDGFLAIEDFRLCDTFDRINTSLFMSIFRWTGTQVVPNINIVSSPSVMEIARNGLGETITNAAEDTTPAYTYPFISIPGSLALYFNSVGLVYSIEFYFQKTR